MTSTLTAPAPAAARHGRRPVGLLLAVLVTLALVVASLFVGVYDLSAEGGGAMFQITRVPRTLALVLAGSAMAVSGLVLQQLTQNRFVEATTSGTSEWAALGLLLSVILLPTVGLATRMVIASAAAFVGTMVFLAVLRRVQVRTTLVVPIVGLMLGAVVSALTTLIAVSTNYLQLLGTWFMGSFTSVVRGQYELLWVVAAVCVAILVLADRLTVAGLGRDVATNLGLDYDRVLLLGTAMVAVASGVTTVVVGFLPFLGLVVPNVVSLLRGDDLRSNLPWVCLGGIALVTACDILGRVVRMPFEVPVGMILGLVGAAGFLALVLRVRRRG
ncbi:iron chelate uptake ABC transporter family permease subunit [Cellulomonas sp. zg-ZUI22]|uniref:ABC transporter permease n=1 Tax=Cellulomonas sp. zg-ZUI22 TaxID=2816955 RepID=UPI001A951199|nr:iron chelate uptake ABC transporter family permease subunit [Cellulomonas sp. zg-ZUI22]MBO0899432.1 iron chelate uptake ABC transporter family permease subunit [Cellulomonas sp. zg-ZUI22]